jgi:GNAT superfamily N-acetyltransferase
MAPWSATLRRTVRVVDDPGVVVTTVGQRDIGDLALLFQRDRSTRSCWCTAFCSTRTQFAFGWVTGRNRRRFEALAHDGAVMGVLAWVDGEPVGWGACGPRSRYQVAMAGRSALLGPLDRSEDDDVWLVPCLYVRADHRGRGLTSALVHAAVDVARQHGARAVEGWPVSGSDPNPADDFVGRESVFAAAGFGCVALPQEGRVIMRHELDP